MHTNILVELKKAVLLAFVLLFLSASLLFVLGFVRIQIVYCSPHTDIDVTTAHNMITNGSFPNLVVLDVRTKSEYDSGHIYGTLWIPHTELEVRINELVGHENHEIIVYCQSGFRSNTASNTLDLHNFTKVYDMTGGILAWQSTNYSIWISTVHNLNTTFNYDTIQEAINDNKTLDGHTILVDAGTYYEHVVVNKSVSLVGEDRETTIIDGNNTGNAVHVTANNVSISSFTIQGGGCGCKKESGLFLENSHNSKVTDNVVTNNGYGVRLLNSSNCVITSNLVTRNPDDGLRLEMSNNLTVTGNEVSHHYMGIYVSNSSNYSIYHNNFLNNTVAYISPLVTTWDDGYPSGGNHWSDYADVDLYSGPYQNETGSDGIGDSRYIDWGIIDDYPLMAPIYTFDAGTWNETACYIDIISNSTISNFNFSQPGKMISFNVTGVDGTTGFCRVTVPNVLLGGPYTVLVNNSQPLTLNAVSNGTHTFLYFTYDHSTKIVQVIGTEVIPELPTWASMLLILIILTVAITIYKRRPLKTPMKRIPLI